MRFRSWIICRTAIGQAAEQPVSRIGYKNRARALPTVSRIVSNNSHRRLPLERLKPGVTMSSRNTSLFRGRPLNKSCGNAQLIAAPKIRDLSRCSMEQASACSALFANTSTKLNYYKSYGVLSEVKNIFTFQRIFLYASFSYLPW